MRILLLLLLLYVLVSCAPNPASRFLALEGRYIEDSQDVGAYRRAIPERKDNNLLYLDNAAYSDIQRARIAGYSRVTLDALQGSIEELEAEMVRKGMNGYARITPSTP